MNKFDGKVTGPRYIVKWVNGAWTIFDRFEFKNCEPNLGTEKNALRVFQGPGQ